MAELEKAILGLECCLETIDDESCPEICPYYSECMKYEKRCIFQYVMRDALTLLKAQEPRVMTLEEMKAIPYDADIWIETEYYVGKITIFAATINTKGLRGVMVYGSHKTYDYEGYNKLWRYWTSRPTDEQRKATPWAEPPKEETK